MKSLEALTIEAKIRILKQQNFSNRDIIEASKSGELEVYVQLAEGARS